jgi:hypothetical protein
LVWLGYTRWRSMYSIGRYVQGDADIFGIGLVRPHVIEILVQDDMYRVMRALQTELQH